MDNPGKLHWEAIKWILIYLQGTTGKSTLFQRWRYDTNRLLVDADSAGNVDIRRSTIGYVYTLGGAAMS